MSETYIPAALRRLVRARAGGVCEYCLLAEGHRSVTFEVDHILSEKHGGPTEADNLAHACPKCNRAKGTDLTSFDDPTRAFVRFFNPRQDNWWEHFTLTGAVIEPLTDIGRVTVTIFQFNHPDRVEERELLIGEGLYPSPEARQRMFAPSA